jgi:heme oxygenase (biliverdin-IX-beta and delta-forming)
MDESTRFGGFGVARTELRRATADVHGALHRHPGFDKLLRGTLEMPEYIALLARLHGFHFPIECALREVEARSSGGIDLIAREKASFLREDLATLGMPEPEIHALPRCRLLPEMRSTEDLYGCLYVIEGAGLGGSAIARKLDYLLGREPTGRQFFLGRPEPDPLPWPVYCALLEVFAATGDLERIVRSARRTFETFALWLKEKDDI